MRGAKRDVGHRASAGTLHWDGFDPPEVGFAPRRTSLCSTCGHQDRGADPASCGGFEAPVVQSTRLFRSFKSKNHTRIIMLLVPFSNLKFNSRLPISDTNFRFGARAGKRGKPVKVTQVS